MEQATLASLFVDRGVKDVVKPELSEDKFSYGPGGVEILQKSHSLIYRAMVKVPGRIDVLTVAKELGDDLDKVGGESYLQYLATACLPQLGVRSTEGLPQWVIAIDTGYSRMFDDFVSLVDKVEDVDSLAADMIEKINRVVLGTASTQYKHISVATSDYKRRMEDEARGFVHTYYPCGWPSFEKFGIPPQAGLMVISGLSSMGKSQLMLQVALGVAIQIKASDSPGTVVFNSYEMKGWRNARRMAACLAAVDYQSLALRKEDSAEYFKMSNALEMEMRN
jgi:replicative DNA helicase